MSSGFSYCLDLLRKINGDVPDGQGVNRLAYTDEDEQGRKILLEAMNNSGLATTIDEVGNIWAIREGSDPASLPVVIGSHVDTVPDGGKYDGTLGVAAALGVVRDISESCSDHRHSIIVAVFSGEESSRFGVSNIGSKAITGFMTLSSFFDYSDSEGVGLFKAMRDFGLSPEFCNRSRLMPAGMKAFLELHIEQGPVLDSSDIDVGVVEAIAAPTRFTLNIKGEAAHSGACPMELRKDALATAAEVILAVEKAGKEESQNGTVATVGVCHVHPDAMNVVPGKVELKVDIRGIRYDSIARTVEKLERTIKSICADRGVEEDIKYLSKGAPVVLDGTLRRLIGNVCDDLAISWKDMPSGAGHDAMYMASAVPTAMIFVPCRDGVSHSNREAIDVGRVRPGYTALLETVKRLVI